MPAPRAHSRMSAANHGYEKSIGRALRSRKLAPEISPNKTWAGAIGSVFGSLLVTGGLYWLLAELAKLNFTKFSMADEVWWYWLIMAVLLNVASQVGDLAEEYQREGAQE